MDFIPKQASSYTQAIHSALGVEPTRVVPCQVVVMVGKHVDRRRSRSP